MSRILDTINKRNPVLKLLSASKLASINRSFVDDEPALPSIIMNFVTRFNQIAKEESQHDLMSFMLRAKVDAWSGGDEDLKKVIEIYKYLILNLAEVKDMDKASSELECFFPAYHILNVLRISRNRHQTNHR